MAIPPFYPLGSSPPILQNKTTVMKIPSVSSQHSWCHPLSTAARSRKGNQRTQRTSLPGSQYFDSPAPRDGSDDTGFDTPTWLCVLIFFLQLKQFRQFQFNFPQCYKRETCTKKGKLETAFMIANAETTEAVITSSQLLLQIKIVGSSLLKRIPFFPGKDRQQDNHSARCSCCQQLY